MLDEELKEEQTSEELRRTLRNLSAQYDRLKHSKDEQLSALYQAMRDGIALLGTPKPIKAPVFRSGQNEDDEEVAVLVMSDWQLGKRTGDYDVAVCEERLHRYLDKVERIVSIQRTDHPVKKAVGFYLGDHVEGEMIFPAQAHQIDSSLTRQVVEGVRISRDLERRKLGMFQEVENWCLIGNHGSQGGPVRYQYNPETNNDRLMYLMLQMMFEGTERITWNIPWERNKRSALAVADVVGSKFLLTHGDLIRGGFAGMPWYGFYKKLLGWQQALILSSQDEKLAFHYFACGHWHNPTTMQFNGIRGWVNGTTESDNEYALENLAAAGRPCQWLLFVHPRHGVTSEWLVMLD